MSRPEAGRRSLLHLVLALCCAVAIVRGLATGAAAADEAPPIAPFKSAHLSIAGTVSAQEQQIPIQGEGDIDATRTASHLTVGLLGATFETVVVDGRTYARNPATGRWEYTEGAQENGFNPARLAPYDPATIRAAGRNFQRVGPEEVDGVATTHWRADVDYPRLLGISSTGPGFGQSVATMDLWVGDADGYLHRLTVDAQGSTTDPTGTSNAFTQALTLTFSNFDAPVQIAAPPDAVPAATPVPGTPVGFVGATPSPRGTAAVAAAPTLQPAAGSTPAAPGETGVSSRFSNSTTVLALVLIVILVAVTAGLVLARRRA